jgi:hypothetical protein
MHHEQPRLRQMQRILLHYSARMRSRTGSLPATTAEHDGLTKPVSALWCQRESLENSLYPRNGLLGELVLGEVGRCKRDESPVFLVRV